MIKHRFYRNIYPQTDDYVVVRVDNVEDTGATVSLLEYNDIKGMVLRTQFAKKYIRSVRKVMRIGSIEVVNVLRVDENKGFIDLSKSAVTRGDYEKAMERYEKSKLVHSISNLICEKLGCDYIDFCEMFIWKWYDKYVHAINAIRLINDGDLSVFDCCEPVGEGDKQIIIQEIKKRLVAPASRIRADFEIRCCTENGIESIKEALDINNMGVDIGGEKIEIKLVSSPQFLIQMDTKEPEKNLELIQNILKKIESKIIQLGGSFKMVYEPKILSGADKNKLDEEWNKVEENFENEKGVDEEEEDKNQIQDY